MRTVVAGFLLAASVSACTSADDRERATARTQWDSRTQQISLYSFTWQEGCFCGEDVTRPIRIQVSEHHHISSATYVDGGAAVPEAVRSRLTTIDGLFDLIDKQVDAGADEVAVTYDPELGFPSSVYIDRYANAADDERSITVSSFVREANDD